MRQAATQARQELVGQMKDILSADQLTQFKQELDQVPLLPGVRPGPRGVPTDELTDRLLSFDKNKDGKIARDEIPERMASLFDQGDANKDGFLTQDEIKTLAANSAQPQRPRRRPGRAGRPVRRPGRTRWARRPRGAAGPAMSWDAGSRRLLVALSIDRPTSVVCREQRLWIGAGRYRGPGSCDPGPRTVSDYRRVKASRA